MKLLVAVKRVIDYNVKPRVRMDIAAEDLRPLRTMATQFPRS